MSLKTEFNRNPYFDDYDASKDFYKILFQPGVSVQTRELNQLQSLFQKQIERFGDNIFATGTIVSGCNFSFNNPYPYIKIRDLTVEGQAAVPYRYVNYNVINEATGLKAWVTSYKDGFEATDPDLKTLYVNYQNTGLVGANTLSFSAGDTLKVYDPVMNGIEDVNIINGGIGFSNTDQLVSISPLIVTISSGSVSEGDYLINNLGANVQVTSVDANTYKSSNQTILQVKPRPADLANVAVSSLGWTIRLGQSLTNLANTMALVVNKVIGDGFQGSIVTDGVGTIQTVNIRSKGANYTTTTAPYITVRSIDNTSGYSTLHLTAKNYLTKLTIATAPSAVGNGYSFIVTEGVIYHKGYFLRVVPQQMIVSKYSQYPDNVAVGFTTNEQIINYNMDPTLLDNAANTINEQAPGADRLKLIPVLQMVDAATASNADFLTIVEWKEGRPFKQNQTTIYSTIGDEMASRTTDASGDFVIDPFLVTTRSPLVANDEGEKFNIVIDPGKAYIDGYRVTTTANYNIDDEKGTDTVIANNHVVSLNYGNYIQINNVGGTFQFNTGDTVDLYDTPRTFLANAALIRAQTLLPAGNKIGVANMRSMLLKDNHPGVAGAIYKLYLFNIQMLPQKNFRDVRSVYYNGTKKGVGDIVTVPDTTTGAGIATLYDPGRNRLTFDVGVETLKNAIDVSYLYRTINQVVTVSNGNVTNATLVVDISANADETFPYTGTLTNAQMSDLIIIPTAGELVGVTGAAGTVVGNNLTANVIGTSTTFLSDFAIGDWVYVTANASGGGELHLVATIANNTFLTLDSNNAFSNTTAKLVRAFPQNVPVPFGDRTRLTANVNLNQNILTIDFGMPFSYSGVKAASVAYNVLRSAPTQSTKTPVRNRFVRLCTSNNSGNTVGPWCLGVPDAFRLRGVYCGNSSVSNTGSNQIKNFYIDHNQNSNYYDLSWLTLIPQASVTLTSNTYILVEFDYFTSSGVGFFDTVSYTHSANAQVIFAQDSQPLSNLVSVVNSFEVPEVFTDDGTEIDLLNQIDFRPLVGNTTAPATTPAGAPLNPSSVVTLSVTGEKKFPLPDSNFTTDIEFYIGRVDSVFVNRKGTFSVVEGTASEYTYKQTRPNTPDDALKIIDLIIPPYPNLPTFHSTFLDEIIDTRVINQKFLTTRITKKTIHAPTSNNVLPYLQPKVYTMSDIGNLERRLSDVEYIAALTALEAGLSQQYIPSSVDPTLDRFKFGFFVDDFTTSGFSDLTNPQYWALKEGEDIVPPKMNWDATLPPGSPNWIDAPIVIQSIATVGSVEDPLGLGPVCALNMANTVAYKTLFKNATDILKTNNPTSITDVTNLEFAPETTIYSSVNYIDTPLNDWLAAHQYDQYKNLQYYLVHDAQNVSTSPIFQAPGARETSGRLVSEGALGALLYWASEGAKLGLNESGSVRFSIGDLSNFLFTEGAHAAFGDLTQNIQNQPELIAYISTLLNSLSLNVATKPSGGTFVDTIYHPPVVLYFYNYDRPVKMEIFQNNNLVTDTSSASVLTDADIELLSGPGSQQWFNDDTQFFMKPFQDTGNGYLIYAGKLTFNYDPALGTNITVKATSPTSLRWRYVIAYPIDGKSVGCVPPTRVYNVPPTFTATYTNISIISWCGNFGLNGYGSVDIMTGVTETWAPFTPPAAVTSVIPFDISKDWYGNR